MAITIPPIFTEVLDEEVTYKRPITEETLRKMAQNINLFGEFAKIGSIRAIQINQVGVAVPDPSIWQLCDGTEITDPSSPLRTVGLTQRFTPNLIGRFVRAAFDESTNNTGGNFTLNLAHTHSTSTVSGVVHGEEGTDVPARQPHNHGINDDLNAAEPLEPASQILAFYIKIN